MRKTVRILTMLLLAFFLFENLSISYASNARIPIGDKGVAITNGNCILFTSDAHLKASNLPALMKAVGQVSLVAFGGDYSTGKSNHLEPDVIRSLKKIANLNGAKAIFAAGNHEGAVSNGDWERFTGMSRVGLAAVEGSGAYEVFLFSAAGSRQEFTEEDITTLRNYLQTVDDTTPIFIVSHFPLHYFNEQRNSVAADQVIDLLNEHPNVIFLWGHNHTVGDPKYGTVLVSGDAIQWGADARDSKQIKFTYANMGCLRDGANRNVYGVTAEIKRNTVLLCYYDLHGAISEVTTIINNVRDQKATHVLRTIPLPPASWQSHSPARWGRNPARARRQA